MSRLMKPVAVAASLVLLALVPWFVAQGVEDTDRPAAIKKDAPAQKPADAAAEDSSAEPEKEGDAPPSREAIIRRALLENTNVEFVQTSLKDCLLALRNQHKIDIILEEAKIQDEGVRLDQPITLALKGVRLRSVLHLLLHPLQLTWVIEDEVLKITTSTRAGETLVTHVYDVQAILAVDQAESELVDLLTSTIQPDSWDEVGGAGSVRAVPLALIVRQTHEVHTDIEKLLVELEILAEDHPARKWAVGDSISLHVYQTGSVSAKELAEAISNLIAPDTWDSAGGKGTVRSVNGALLVKNSIRVHQQVAKLVSDLNHSFRGGVGGHGSSKAGDNSATPEAPAKPEDKPDAKSAEPAKPDAAADKAKPEK